LIASPPAAAPLRLKPGAPIKGPTPHSAEARAKLIDKIILSRFLERSATFIHATVKNAENAARRNGLFDGHAPAIRRRIIDGGLIAKRRSAEKTFAEIRVVGKKPVLFWRSPYFVCEYTVDDLRLRKRLAVVGSETSRAILRAVRTLLLATTRNGIACGAARMLFAAQRAFLLTGVETRLAPLTVVGIAGAVRAKGVKAADASRISRVLRSTVVRMPNGEIRALRALCPTSRMVLSFLVRAMLERERGMRARGLLRQAWSDQEVARRIRDRARIRVSRRLVAHCRKSLGIPASSARSCRGDYSAATIAFSALGRLKAAEIARIPASPGLYELRVADSDVRYMPDCSGIIYIGKTINLRSRLLTHACPNGRNGKLAEHVRNSRVLFRFRAETHDLKLAERELYRQFVETFGHRPECNRMSP
jgi:hypothetical protein